MGRAAIVAGSGNLQHAARLVRSVEFALALQPILPLPRCLLLVRFLHLDSLLASTSLNVPRLDVFSSQGFVVEIGIS